MGLVHTEFTPINTYGFLDRVVTLPDGIKVLNPFRIIPHDTGSELIFTVRPSENFEEDCQAVAENLERLAPGRKSDPTEWSLSDFEALNKKQANRSSQLRFACFYMGTLSVDGFELRSQVLTATSYCSNDADRNEDGKHCVEGPGDGAGDEDGEIANRGQQRVAEGGFSQRSKNHTDHQRCQRVAIATHDQSHDTDRKSVV